ncbi:hypothetical protein [Treponema pedis]|uniref:DUF304 domain-containing protein n=1 Tax=Treponema pedis str. T A4 TaxID=1291379 RepID=S5ZWN2_9SPIR|nr:hypothetical protein [Treponema pedis]AGT44810.1 hypothetical protein TPE_2336 [Treponema pedis str. T A4]
MNKINSYNPEIIKFAALKPWLRWTALAFSVLIFSINISSIKTGEHSITAMVIGAVFLFASLYENSWQFNLNEKTAVLKRGLIFLAKKRLINFSAIHSITVDTFKQPARFGTFTQIYMKLTDGETIIIDRDKTKALQREIERIAEVQELIRKNNEQKAEDFFNAVAADILNTDTENKS